MKVRDKDKKFKFFDFVGLFIIISVICFGGYFIYGLTQSILKDDKSIISDQVWCANCQTYHDKATAEEEQQKLVWCVNCQKYHAPGEDN